MEFNAKADKNMEPVLCVERAAINVVFSKVFGNDLKLLDFNQLVRF